MLINSY